MDLYNFYTGKSMNIYEYLGCHLEDTTATFCVFAPAATAISVIGDFNDWNETPMQKIENGQFWECKIEDIEEGMRYQYRIYKSNGTVTDHCDPYGFAMELRPAHSSIVCRLDNYQFKDEKWLKHRTDCKEQPLNIYELHLGSWKKDENMENGWYNYRQIAEELIPYVKEQGYNYIEVMPISEHPCDNSWGYQNTGFYSPTSRYGKPADLKAMIDTCHQNGIGVLLDFVPVHFAVDDYALAMFDGTPLFEYPNTDVGNSEWGSKNFMHSRGEVQCFLQSCANYWIKEFHFDGLRMDAISNIIYWQGDKNRGVNGNAVDFVKHMNQELKRMYPSIILAAEDSTAFPDVTKPVAEGGLGFDYKWDMGWMNDTLAYFKENPSARTEIYHKLTFSMMYYYQDNFLLPLSHDEVVHCKGTILQKMYGDLEEQFRQARAFYLYMYAHPGKKLNFMGNELGHIREWDENRALDWELLESEAHRKFHLFRKALNEVYLNTRALWERDYEETGFRWLNCHEEEKNIYLFVRKGKKETVLAVFNFSDTAQTQFEVSFELLKEFMNGIPKKLELLIASEEERFGGIEKLACTTYAMTNGSVKMDIAACSGYLFRCII